MTISDKIINIQRVTNWFRSLYILLNSDYFHQFHLSHIRIHRSIILTRYIHRYSTGFFNYIYIISRDIFRSLIYNLAIFIFIQLIHFTIKCNLSLLLLLLRMGFTSCAIAFVTLMIAFTTATDQKNVRVVYFSLTNATEVTEYAALGK